MGQNTDRRALVRDRFDRAMGYEGAATMQRVAAQRLFEKLQERMEGRVVPLRILELGCGTGFLTEKLRNAWPQADIVATDIAPHMLERAQQRVGEGLCYRIMDAGEPDVSGSFDIVCGNLVFQWLEHPQQAIARLGRLLSPGGILALSTLMDGTFQEWRTACAVEHEESGTPDYPSTASIGQWYPSLFNGGWETEACVQTFSNGRAFLRHLKETGASVPRAGYRPMQLSALRRSLARFDAQGSVVTWRLAYGCFQKPPRAGVFITGTDTGVGKTFVSACLVKAWEALYWKPLQSGLAEEAGDTPTILSLTHCAPEDCLPPAGAFQAPLSPEAAARAEGVAIDPASLALRMQEPERPMVVEGAGGLMVPATETLMMCDLAAQWGLPVVLVARSGLGTLNHTLLSLEALRQRGIAVAGVVLNGPLNPANRETITEKGKVRILAEIPFQADVSAQSVEGIAQTLPSWADVRGGA